MPKTIQVWHDTRGRARCRGCDARIEWAEIVASGRRMCFDDDIVVLQTVRDPESHRLIDVVDLTRNHWATCVARDQFRGRGR
jgi:hypothetical protein